VDLMSTEGQTDDEIRAEIMREQWEKRDPEFALVDIMVYAEMLTESDSLPISQIGFQLLAIGGRYTGIDNDLFPAREAVAEAYVLYRKNHEGEQS
jgi:hypothetical protein